MKQDPLDPRIAKALWRYEVISAFIAENPPRGRRGALLQQLANKTWPDEQGTLRKVEAETLRTWVRRYRREGLQGLCDKQRPRRGIQALTADQVDLVCKLKREVPERSLDRIIIIAEAMKLIEPDVLRRSTLHRVLKTHGLSARAGRVPDAKDLDRYEADLPNGTWQSDMLVGPWLPDPQRPGKMRRAYLYAFVDDHSRLLLHGRFSFKGDLPALELVFRRCLQKYGVPKRVYYDNGQVYRSSHMKQIVATLGMHRPVFTKPYRPMGHGKIEALNRLIRSAFIAEVPVSRITTLDPLNEAFLAWADEQYNRRVHNETGQAPLERWRQGADQIQYADEETLRQAFLWREERTTDKTGIFSLFGQRYQVRAQLARQRLEVRYDPEALDEVEVWHQGQFMERVRPFAVHSHRRPRDPGLKDVTQDQAAEAPTADWLGHLMEQRRQQGFIEPPPRQFVEDRLQQRAEANDTLVSLLREHLDVRVVDDEYVRNYLERFGPFNLARAQAVVEGLIAGGLPADTHISFVLDAIRDDPQQGADS